MKINKKSIFTFLVSILAIVCLKVTPVLAADEITIPDANLRQAIINELGKTADYKITTYDMESLKTLTYYDTGMSLDKKITSLEGLQYCTKLTSLNLANNNITDISPINKLVNLEYLSLDNNKVYDLSSLTSLKHLEKAYVCDQKITLPDETIYEKRYYSFVNPLKDKFSSPVKDITKISNEGIYYYDSNKLGWFNLENTNNLNFSFSSDYHVGSVRYAFSGIVYKKVTYAERAVIPDKNLKAALNKALNKSETSEISKDELLTLKSFDAESRNIVSLQGLEYCKNLKVLNLSCNKICNLSPLKTLTNLEAVYLDNNCIYDLSPLSSLSQLSTLSAGDQEVVLPAETITKRNFRMKNPLIDKYNKPVNNIYRISNGGYYYNDSNYLGWFNLPDNVTINFSFEKYYKVGSAFINFSGRVTKELTFSK